MAWPPTGFTLQWFFEALGEPGRAARRSSTRSSSRPSATALSPSCSGRWRAWPSSATRSSGSRPISFLLVIPIALPGRRDRPRVADVVRHDRHRLRPRSRSSSATPRSASCIAYNNVDRAAATDCRVTPEEASADLGADTFHDLPAGHAARRWGRRSSSGALLAFALSFDEIIVTNFTAGAGTQTLPIWILPAHPAPGRTAASSTSSALILILISVDPGLHRDADQLRRRRRRDLTVSPRVRRHRPLPADA